MDTPETRAIPADDSGPSLGNDLFRQVVEMYVRPELAKRNETGLEVRAAQVVMAVGQAVKVRLNEEVRAVVRRSIRKREEVGSNDIGDLESIELMSHDPNSAHITVLLLETGWSIAFDFRYNRAEVARHLAVAAEFLEGAAAACERAHLHAFTDSLFSAAELTAKAELLMLPDPQLLGDTNHRFVASQFNRRWRGQETVQEQVRLLNQLGASRYPARYLRRKFTLTSEEGRRRLAVAREFHARVSAQEPSIRNAS